MDKTGLFFDEQLIGTYDATLFELLVMYLQAYSFISKKTFKLNFLKKTNIKSFKFKTYIVHKEKLEGRYEIVRILFNEESTYTYLFLIRNDLNDIERKTFIIHEMFHMFYYMTADKKVSENVVEKVTNYNSFLFIARFYYNYELIKKQIPNINISKESLLEYFELLKKESKGSRILSNETINELLNADNHTPL